MKILHTADWHIGQLFHGYDRITEHQSFLDWLTRYIKENEIDVLLVAGDIFDVSNPSATAQRLFYKFLANLYHEVSTLKVLIAAGNHDSPSRLESPKDLLHSLHIEVVGNVKKNTEGEIDFDNLLIPIRYDESGEPSTVVALVPFLRQGDYPTGMGYEEGVTEFYKRLFAYAKQRFRSCQQFLVTGHFYASGAELVQKEESSAHLIGGLDLVGVSDFADQWTYVALGHIHKTQRVAKNEHIRYSGSPFAMSFAEINYNHGVDIIELDEQQVVSVEHIHYPHPIKLLTVPKSYEVLPQVLEELRKIPYPKSVDADVSSDAPFLEVRVLQDGPEPTMREQIEQVLNEKNVRLCSIKTQYRPTQEELDKPQINSIEDINPEKLIKDTYQAIYHNELPDDLFHLFEEAKREVEERDD